MTFRSDKDRQDKNNKWRQQQESQLTTTRQDYMRRNKEPQDKDKTRQHSKTRQHRKTCHKTNKTRQDNKPRQ